ncbi:MAG: pili assembly chaperone [Terriglobales bacterium]
MSILAVIAIPNLIRSRISSGESNFVGSLRTINTANVTYYSTYPKRGFAPSLRALGGPAPCTTSAETACLIDDVLANGLKSGYRYSYRAFDHDRDGVFEAYTVNSHPIDPSAGQRHFFTDQSGVIRFELGKPATANSPPLQ